MLPKLSQRAAARCESNVLRYFPAWKQAQIRASGEGLSEMEAFIDLNKDHLSKLRELIAEGERVCIDAGWPQPGGEVEPEPAPEPEIIEKVVEVKVKDPETEAKLADALSKLEAAQAKVEERKPETSDFKFKVPFLQSERLVNEDLSDADYRLFNEYTGLELNRPLEPKDDARWRILQAGLFDFKG